MRISAQITWDDQAIYCSKLTQREGGGGAFRAPIDFSNAVEPQYNDLRYNDISDITIKILYPGKSYSEMYGTEPRYNDLRYKDVNLVHRT